MAWNISTSKQKPADLEILRHQVNVDVAPSIVLDASTVAPDPVTGERKLVAGTPLTKNSNNQYQRWSNTTNQNVQVIAIDATSGNYTLTKGGQTTAAIDFDATEGELEEALEDLSNVTDVEVTLNDDGNYVVSFVNPDEAAAITADDTNLVGGGSSATITRAGLGCLGILLRTEVFPDGTSRSDLPSAMWNHGQWFRADRIVDFGTLGASIKAALPTCRFD